MKNGRKIVGLTLIFLLLLAELVLAASLTVIKVGTGYGDIDGEDISCGPFCSAIYHEKSVIELKASPYDDSTFEGWMVNGKPHEGVIVIDQEDIIITARFNLKSPPDELEVMWYTGNDTERAMMVLDEIAVFPAKSRDKLFTLEGDFKTAMEEVARLFHPEATVLGISEFYITIQSPVPVTKTELPAIFAAIRKHEYVRQVGPVFYANKDDPNSEIIPTGEIVVQFPSSYTAERITMLEQEYGLTRLKSYPHDPHDIVYQVEDPLKAIEIANRLYESGLVEYSSPDFIVSHQVNFVYPKGP